jgi:hypothetical protein
LLMGGLLIFHDDWVFRVGGQLFDNRRPPWWIF